MENNAVKKDNRKALPKFLLILLGAALFGGVLGFFAGWMGYSSVSDTVREVLDHIVSRFLPWAIPAVCLALLAESWRRYRKARKLFEGWDGSNEEPLETADRILNWSLLWSSLAMVLNLFSISISSYCTLPGSPLVVTVLFLLILVLTMLLQQKVVDLTRQINPEKQGSIYDTKFQKKWFESCDEAEKAQIGQAAYKAYNATAKTAIVLWIALVVLDFIFGFGPLPAFTVLLVWGVAQTAYILECIRLEKGGSR